MAVLPFNNSPFRIYVPKRGRIRFIPKGSYIYSLKGGVRSNPFDNLLSYEKNYAARFIIGLSVSHVPVWTVQQVIDYVREWLKKNKWKEDASFIAQKGVYTEEPEDKKKPSNVYQEDSVQIIVFKMDTGPEEVFNPLMQALAQDLARKFRQKSVILDYQENGITKGLWSVTA